MNIKKYNFLNIILSIIGVVGITLSNTIINYKFSHGYDIVHKILIILAIGILFGLAELLILKLIKKFTEENVTIVLFSIEIVIVLHIYNELSHGYSALYKLLILLALAILGGLILSLITRVISTDK
ncbi:hypothetical protein [Streptobacillus ratti]|uniref:hypothetical protein n=1 Tax=Streptobacillus ratti TaxID=1720557 RepID=UPI000934655D|nr:hypothetical protein [Streptobacillus ratti]